jgi:hypothetical protein
MNKRDLLEAWEKSMAAKEIYHESRFAYNTITDFLKSIPDDEPDATCVKCGNKFWSARNHCAECLMKMGKSDDEECEHIGCVPPNTECDVVTERIRHGLEWAAKTAQPKVPEWEKTLAYIARPGTIVNFEEVKQLFREEMKKLALDFKKKLLPDRYYPDVKQHVRNETWIDNAILECLKERGI